MQYDLTFVTNIPAFYKVNLFNKLNENIKIKVIFISKTSIIRNGDFYGANLEFDHVFISNRPFEQRNKLKVFFSLFTELFKTNSKVFIYSGWETKEACLCSYFTRKNKNAIVIESSILGTQLSGVKLFLKNAYLNRMSIGLPSGVLQKAILLKLNFSGQIRITHGVGISNYIRNNSSYSKADSPSGELTFLYIGRLSPEKNLKLLIRVFENLSHKLVIVGSGEEEDELKKLATDNISFLGYKNNKDLITVFQCSDVFILPSLSEPWGLVVEEALIFGLPVIVSDRVGCKDDLVNSDVGLIFESTNITSLLGTIEHMEKNISFYRNRIRENNYLDLNDKQLSAYYSLVKKNS